MQQESNEKSFEEKCQNIIEQCPSGSDDLKMRYLTHELSLILAKNVDFFYGSDEEKKDEIYNNYEMIDGIQAICRNSAYRCCEMAKQLNLKCNMIEMDSIDDSKYNHWAIEYYGENNKRYLINLIPDLYRIQLGFSTEHFCTSFFCIGYHGEPFDQMSSEYLREMDKKLGYLNSGMYTEELLSMFAAELESKLGRHILSTSLPYQHYYQTLLNLIKNEQLSLAEKVVKIKEIDSDFIEHHKDILENCFLTKTINQEMKKRIRNYASQKLLGTEYKEENSIDGAKFVATMDISKLQKLHSDILIYKFNYMMQCFPQLANALTGFIESKNFLDELKKYVFHAGERNCINRHTVISNSDGNTKYYMMLDLKPNQDSEEKIYGFYNWETKEYIPRVDPLEFMLKHNLKPLKNSSLDKELLEKMNLHPLYQSQKMERNQSSGKGK